MENEIRTVAIWGYSDDIIYFENVDKAIDNTEEDDPMFDVMCRGKAGEFSANMFGEDRDRPTFVLANRILVIASYDGEGVWGFRVTMLTEKNEEVEESGYPNWPTRLMQNSSNGHSMRVEIDIPLNFIPVVRIR